MKKETKKEADRKLHIEILRQMVTLSTSGFGLVAALAWNNVIQDFVENYLKRWLPEGSSIYSLLIYAVIVTVLAVLVTLQLSRVLENLEQKK